MQYLRTLSKAQTSESVKFVPIPSSYESINSENDDTANYETNGNANVYTIKRPISNNAVKTMKETPTIKRGPNKK
jgi:hypothetical protein